MKTITLTMLQRAGLEQLIGQKTGKRDSNVVFYRIRKKIKVLQADKAAIAQKQEANKYLGDDAYSGYPEVEVSLETEEVRKLKDLLNDTEVPLAWLDWMEPVMEKLNAE